MKYESFIKSCWQLLSWILQIRYNLYEKEKLINMNKIKKYFYLFIGFLISGCTSSDATKTLRYNGLVIKGNIQTDKKDTVFIGPIEYYDLSGRMISKVNYKGNKKFGIDSQYSSTGTLKQETNYFYRDENGVNKIYDDSGHLISTGNYFHGLVAGPQLQFKQDSIFFFKFVNFENWELYSCRFIDGQAIEKGNLLNYITHYVLVDGKKQLKIFIYLINPPHKELTYTLYKKNLTTGDSVVITSINGKQNFYDDFNIDLPSDKERLYFNVKAYYPKEDITVPNILQKNQEDLRLPTEFSNNN